MCCIEYKYDVLSVYVTNSGSSAGLAQNSGKYYYLKDMLGSITDISDSSGNIVQKYEYSAYGTIYAIRDNAGNDVTSSPVVNTSFTYTGREWDAESGLYYYRARYYDASTGRFLQQDPDPGKLRNPATFLSKYAYAGNNPVMYSDPSGRFFGIDDFLFIVGLSIIQAAFENNAVGGNFLDSLVKNLLFNTFLTIIAIDVLGAKGLGGGNGPVASEQVAKNILKGLISGITNIGIDSFIVSSGLGKEQQIYFKTFAVFVLNQKNATNSFEGPYTIESDILNPINYSLENLGKFIGSIVTSELPEYVKTP